MLHLLPIYVSYVSVCMHVHTYKCMYVHTYKRMYVGTRISPAYIHTYAHQRKSFLKFLWRFQIPSAFGAERLKVARQLEQMRHLRSNSNILDDDTMEDAIEEAHVNIFALEDEEEEDEDDGLL